MNQIDKFFLWFFMLPASLYEKVGVDNLQLRAILTAKLTIDNRRQPTFQSTNRKREKKEMKKATISTMFGALFMGLFLLYCLMYGVDFTTKLTFFMTMFIFMLCLTLITDFTSVLIDVRDNFIILPKPITDATFVASRLLHITIRTCLIVLPLSLPAFITAIIMQGVNIVLPFILMVLMSSLFSIFLINAAYILILKITTPTKFQSIISYIQIGFSIFIFAGYQLMPRMMQNSLLTRVSLVDVPYIGFFPPYWFADACISMAKMDFSGNGWISFALAMLVPVISIWVVLRFFAPSFNRKLSMITARTEEQSKKTGTTVKKTKFLQPELLASLFTRQGSEYMGFLFSWKMMSRSRDFKMKVYPSLGMVLVLGVMMIFNSPFKGHVIPGQHSEMNSIMLMVVYLSCLVLMTALTNLPYTDKHKASWIFYSAPVESPGKVICGAVKSAMVSFYIPIAILLLIFSLVLMGLAALPNLLLGCSNVLATGALVAYMNVRKLPFSQVLDGTANGGTFIKSLLPLIVMGLLGFIHWLISGYIWIVLPFLAVSPFITWFVLNEIKKLSWEKLS